MMTRAEKAAEITVISEKFGKAKAAFLVDFKGMSVEEVTQLRKTLNPLDSEMRVVRNTLAKLALKEHPEMETAISNSFEGPNAVVFAYEDVSGPAKALSNFSKEVESLSLKTGVMDGKALDEAQINYLATLPGKDELRAKLLGTLQAPMGKFLRVCSEVPGSFVRVLNAHKDSKQ